MGNTYRGRRAVSIDNGLLRVTVLEEGGHIAELMHLESGVNPLWTPPWPSIEPSTYDRAKHPEYGDDAESKLLAGIMGHNLCLDVFGPPSEEEAAAGMTVHGEASVARWEVRAEGSSILASVELPSCGLRVERRLELAEGVSWVKIQETVENLEVTDRPIAWTQHVTLGPPFLERGVTEFKVSAGKSRTLAAEIPGSVLQPGAIFDWPNAPRMDGSVQDLQRYTDALISAEFTTHLVTSWKQAHALAYHPGMKVLCGYLWRSEDFPWIGIWDENHSRQTPPWNGNTLTRGLEFGVSPFPETRRRMIERNGLFGVPGYRWIPAKGKAQVQYHAFVTGAPKMPENVIGDGTNGTIHS